MPVREKLKAVTSSLRSLKCCDAHLTNVLKYQERVQKTERILRVVRVIAATVGLTNLNVSTPLFHSEGTLWRHEMEKQLAAGVHPAFGRSRLVDFEHEFIKGAVAGSYYSSML
jgi:hypothetical protein